MWSHIRGPSHLAVQRVNQLVNSGSEWTIKTLEAVERKVLPLIVLLTLEGNSVFHLLDCCVTQELTNRATKTDSKLILKRLQNMCRPQRGNYSFPQNLDTII